jgi:hypothetical protein
MHKRIVRYSCIRIPSTNQVLKNLYPFYQPCLEKFHELKCLIILRLFLAKNAKKRQVSKGSYKLIYLLRPLRNLRALCVNRKGDNRYPVSLKIA